jgi:hypoxanthine-DNA glycosylase
MARLLGFSDDATYSEKVAALRTSHIALWDVIGACQRRGSLDASIEPGTIQTNDFVSLFEEYPNIEKICFNGKKSETEYMKRIFPSLSGQARVITLAYLPSTSPAMASVSFEEKTDLWSKEIKGE